MSKHTPGDWTVAFYAIQDGAGGSNVCSVKAGTRTLARTACQVITDEDEANIRLMAAAPDMLAACEEVLNEVAAGCDLSDDTCKLIEVALAKAERRTT